jgi:hypothetical protein
MRSSEELVVNDPEAALRAMTEAAFGGDEQAAIAYATERARALVHPNEKPQEEPAKEQMSPPPPEHAWGPPHWTKAHGPKPGEDGRKHITGWGS